MFTELPSHRNRYAMLQMVLLLLEGFPPFRLVVTLARIDEPSTVPDEMLVFFLPCSLHPPMLYLKTSITSVLVTSSAPGSHPLAIGSPMRDLFRNDGVHFGLVGENSETSRYV